MGARASGDHGADPPRELVVRFWTVVILVKIAVLALGGGTVIVLLTEFLALGIALIGIGFAAVFRSIWTARQIQSSGDGHGV